MVKLFYKNDESITVTLRRFRTKKGLKAQKNAISLNGILNLIQRSEETLKLEDRLPRARSALTADCVHVVQGNIEGTKCHWNLSPKTE